MKNGSGKSTFINVVSGHYPTSGGEIFFEGRQLAGLPAHRIAQSGIARTYQIPRPFAHLTVLQNVSLVAMFGGAALDSAQATQEARVERVERMKRGVLGVMSVSDWAPPTQTQSRGKRRQSP